MTVTTQRQFVTLAARRVSLRTVLYGVACLLPVLTAFVIKWLTMPVPFMDEWDWADLIYRMHLGTLHFGDLWMQHNEHRILVSNLIALGLAQLGGWSQLRESLFGLLLVVATQVGVFVLLRRIVAPRALPFLFLLASLLLYSLAQIENWDWGFQFGWFLCNACAVWALVLLGTAGQSSLALIAAAALATIASFSLSQGLMIWPAGVATLLLTEKRRPVQIVAWVVVACAVFGLYFRGYMHPAGHPDPFLALHHPLATLRYLGAYFGSVFAGWVSFAAAVAVGWAGMAALVYLLWLVIAEYRVDRRQGSRMASFVGLAVFALSVAAITAAGRLGFGEAQAQASRYTSIAIYLWITVFALGAALEQRVAPGIVRLVRIAAPGLIVIALVLYLGADRAGIALGKGRLAQVETGYTALLLGRGQALTVLYPAEAPVQLWIKELQAVKDGPYYQ